VAVALLLAATTFAQGRPDFTGNWIFDEAKSANMDANGKVTLARMLGDRFQARQDAATLTLTITSGGLKVTAIYQLDGSESRNMSPDGAGRPDVAVISRASWEGDKLVIRSTSTSEAGDKPLTIESVRTLWLDASGSLILDRTGTPASEVPPTRSVYTKVRTIK
jgi:hypothetical protein